MSDPVTMVCDSDPERAGSSVPSFGGSAGNSRLVREGSALALSATKSRDCASLYASCRLASLTMPKPPTGTPVRSSIMASNNERTLSVFFMTIPFNLTILHLAET